MRFLATMAALAITLSLSGCPNPNAIGVQIYGTIVARVTDASNGQPVGGALVVINSNQNCTTVSDGSCQVGSVPVGTWNIKAYAPGLFGCANSVAVMENQTTSVNVSMTSSPCA